MTTEDTTAAAPPPLTEEEQAQIDYYQALMQAEDDGDTTDFSIGPRTLFELIGVLQLALRHPQLPGGTSDRVLQVTRQLATVYQGTMGEVIIAKGFNPDYDYQPASGPGRTFHHWFTTRYPSGDPPVDGLFGGNDMAEAYAAGYRAAAADGQQP